MDPYRILGVSQSSNDDEIKKAYLNLAKEWHPDRNNSLNAAEKFKLINAAYDIIKSKEKVSNTFKHNDYSYGGRETKWKSREQNTGFKLI